MHDYVYFYVNDQGERVFCFAEQDGEYPRQISSLEDVKANLTHVKKIYPDVEYKIAKISIEVIE